MNSTNMLATWTKKLLLLILLLIAANKLFAAKTDSLVLFTLQQDRAKPTSIDSLKNELDITIDDSLKATLYTQLSLAYLKYDTVADKKERRSYQNEAIKNTLSALHYYSRYNDTIGLRTSFDILARVYHAEHKYPQAKWFILQSNTLARYQNDKPNIIASLIELSSIKSDIKDYTLAMRDLNEALTISSKNHYPLQESEVELHYALLYNVMKNYTKGSLAMRRHDAILDSIKTDQQARLMAKVATKDSLLQAKKKLYLTSSKRFYKINSSKRIASL